MLNMKRVLVSQLQKDIHKKILILTGPRQSGKTTLSKMIGPDFEYLNYDQIQHRKTVHEQSWDRKKDYVILDEIHKMKNWKRFLKGIYDTEGLHPGLMITGSARLDAYKKMGDSLAGRFFQYRLHPLDVRELITLDPKSEPKKCIERILRFGGFPEPYLEGTEGFYTKWKKSHIDIILRQDMIDLESVRNLVAIETMVELLKSRVGNPLSYQSLSEDLQYSDKTIKNWIRILENM